MSYQKCPICNGEGVVFNSLNTLTFEVCTTCKGKKIIHVDTGLPPDYGIGKSDEENGFNKVIESDIIG